MGSAEKTKLALDRKFKGICETPAGFNFFVSLHDFVQYIEATPSFGVFFRGTKGSRASEIPQKYSILKQIYQGIEDIDVRTTNDLGHDRYVAIRELSLIRNKDVSDNNPFWKRRESLRKLAGDIHKTLHGYLSE
ncbi:MAG: hypothetical protein ABSC29_01535 [Minisyncoccia bacterium]|jgi:hypothetical protein